MSANKVDEPVVATHALDSLARGALGGEHVRGEDYDLEDVQAGEQLVETEGGGSVGGCGDENEIAIAGADANFEAVDRCGLVLMSFLMLFSW